jgi:hemerythrin-like domain-containing protein
MQPTAARAREHQIIFCGLEVLRLMGERIQSRHDVDRQDIETVLKFMREVAHRCLDNTEDILRFASMDGSVANHQRARSLFDQLNTTASSASATDEFAELCRRYTDLLATSIFEDRRCLSTLDCDLTTLSQFYEWEREVDELARAHGQALHRLETKYTMPHCI